MAVNIKSVQPTETTSGGEMDTSSVTNVPHKKKSLGHLAENRERILGLAAYIKNYERP